MRPAQDIHRHQTPVGAVGIEAAAADIGVSPSALRMWERQGLIRPARTRGGLRRYAPADVARLRTIHRLRSVDGLNAAAIRRVLDADQGAPRDDVGRAGAGGATPRSAGLGPGSPSVHARLLGPDPGARPGPVAARLRALRTQRRMTLREAARRSGLSVSFVSGLERGVTGASIAALRRLTEAYGTTLAELLDERVAGRLVAPHERRVLDTGSGVRIEHLASASVSLEPQLFVLAPGASSEGAYSHPGEEFMYVLDGLLGVWLGEDEFYRLGTGDALTFPSTIVHRFQALGATETRLLWVNTPPTF